MSLSKEQKRDLMRLSEYFRKIEKLAIANNIDLDVFMSEYSKDGYRFYVTEQIGPNQDAGKRKQIFEEETAAKEKNKQATKQ
jgi:hypothetical protein